MLGVDLQTAEGESILIYETRNTSEAFCKELVHHNAKQFVNEAAEKTKESKKKLMKREVNQKSSVMPQN